MGNSHRQCHTIFWNGVCPDVTCGDGAGAGNTGLSRAARRRCRDEADVVEPAARHLDLLHVGLAGDGNDGLKLGATNSAHRDGLHWFHVLKAFGRETLSERNHRFPSRHLEQRGVGGVSTLPGWSFGWRPL